MTVPGVVFRPGLHPGVSLFLVFWCKEIISLVMEEAKVCFAQCRLIDWALWAGEGPGATRIKEPVALEEGWRGWPHVD